MELSGWKIRNRKKIHYPLSNSMHLLYQTSGKGKFSPGFIVGGPQSLGKPCLTACHDHSSTQRTWREGPRGYIFTALLIVTLDLLPFSEAFSWLRTPGMRSIEWEVPGVRTLRCARKCKTVLQVGECETGSVGLFVG